MNCRYCLEVVENAFSPCNCKGSLKYVHEKCLITWLKYKKIFISNFDYHTCEICKKTYNFTITTFSPFSLPIFIKTVFILFIMYFSFFYILFTYSLYFYCLEFQKNECENILRFNKIILYSILTCINIIYLCMLGETYFKYEYIKFRLINE